jgi:hypothetical protein
MAMRSMAIVKSGDPRAFWKWVSSHAQELRRRLEGADPLLDDVRNELHRYCPELYFEVGGLPGATTALIITAEGNSSAFDAVRALVDAAPSLPGWEFIAFKPAQGFAFVTEHGRARIDASRSWFMPLESKSAPTQFGLVLACDEYSPDAHDDFMFAARVVIRTGLGELAAATSVHHIEIEETPSAPASRGYIELPELPQYLSWRARGASN